MTPTGKVTVSDGRRNCEAVLKGSHGHERPVRARREKRAGRYLLRARYAGDKRFGSSFTHRATPLTINRAAA